MAQQWDPSGTGGSSSLIGKEEKSARELGPSRTAGKGEARLMGAVPHCWGCCGAARLPGSAQSGPFQPQIAGFVRNKPRQGSHTPAQPTLLPCLSQLQEPSLEAGGD